MTTELSEYTCPACNQKFTLIDFMHHRDDVSNYDYLKHLCPKCDINCELMP